MLIRLNFFTIKVFRFASFENLKILETFAGKQLTTQNATANQRSTYNLLDIHCELFSSDWVKSFTIFLVILSENFSELLEKSFQ